MENASKDVLFTIAMNLDLPNLLRWCASNSRINRDVCQNDNVWRSKLIRDYPDYRRFDLDKSLRETYVFLYQLSYIKKLLKTKESLYDIFLTKTLDLSSKGLKKVPAFELPHLRRLSLSNNQLTEVPEFALPNLEVLYLSDNRLTKVPAFNLPNLRELSLSGNPLRKVPAFDLPNLQHLYLNSNQLTEVPTFHLPNLRTLYLMNNRLTEVVKKELKEKYKGKIVTE